MPWGRDVKRSDSFCYSLADDWLIRVPTDQCNDTESWGVQNNLWKKQGPAGDVFCLQGSFCFQTRKGIFKLLCILGKKKNKELCSVQLNTYVAQMLAGGLPTPQELCKISSNLHQFHDPRKSKSLPKIAPKSWGTEALGATLSSKVLLSELDLETGSIDVTWELVMNVASVPTLRFRPTDSEPAFPQGPQVICVHGTVWEAWL